MDETWKLIFLAAPTLVTAIAAIIGLRAWYWQLVAKRRFEVAEQSITTFDRANDALSAIRSPGSFSREYDQISIPEGISPEQATAMRDYGIFHKRVHDRSEDFAEIAATAKLCEIYFGHQAADAMKALLAARITVLVAVDMMIEDSRQRHSAAPGAVEQRKKALSEYRADIIAVAKPNPLNERLAEARRVLASKCEPYLREQSFWEFLWGRKA